MQTTVTTSWIFVPSKRSTRAATGGNVRQGEEVYLKATFARTLLQRLTYMPLKKLNPTTGSCKVSFLHLVFNPFKLTVLSNENDNQQEKNVFWFLWV